MSLRSLYVYLLVSALSTGVLASEGRPRTLDAVLTGKITALVKDEIEVVYDFSDPAHLKDWIAFKPFRVEGDLTKGLDGASLRMKGVGALRHRVTFQGKVEIEVILTPWSDRDFGVVVGEDAEGEQYVLYCVNDYYFQKWDGAHEPQHMICRFGIKDPSEPEEFKAFRYVARSTQPEVKTHQKIRLIAKKDGRDDEFHIGDRKLQGKDMGRELLGLLAGVYVVKSSVVIEQITVRGRVSPRWLDRENAVMTLSAPLPEKEEGPSEADRAAAGKIGRFRSGIALPEEVFGVIEDAEVNEEIREQAATALIETGDKSLVPQIISLLYSEEFVVRRLAISVVKGLAGNAFGYDAKGDEEKRSKAIQKLVKYIQRKPAEFRSGR